MTSSLVYTLFSQIKPFPLPPNPLFILLLIALLPVAMVGALTVQWNRSLSFDELLARNFTSLACTLIGVSGVEALWQFAVRPPLGALHLLLLLVVAALSAAFGAHGPPCAAIIAALSRVHAMVKRIGWLAMLLLAPVGALFGYLLTFGFALSIFSASGILVGVAIAVGLMWVVDLLVRRNGRKHA
jgi:hypothetical protein